MKISRTWAMPSPDTFDVEPIGLLVQGFLRESKVSVDPFARNKRWATHTNDLNPNTTAQHHMDVLDFLVFLRDSRVRADLVIFDPPYSPTQLKRAYDDIEKKMSGTDALRTSGWAKEKDVISDVLTDDGIVLCFGWDSCGMGKGRGFELKELLLVCHGGGRNDTICTVEQRIQPRLF